MNILITGGASGLGLSVTTELANNKSNTIHFTYYKSTHQAKVLMAERENVKGTFCDFTHAESVNNLLNYIHENSFDVLINNAYVGPLIIERFSKASSQQWLQGYTVNVVPTLQITQCMLAKFRAQQFGKIITVLSSTIVGNPPKGWSQYNAEKSYLSAMCKSWAIENITFNITSNAVSPSYMNTPIHKDQDHRLLEIATMQHPFNKLLTTNEAATVVAFLVNCSQQINGINIPIQTN